MKSSIKFVMPVAALVVVSYATLGQIPSPLTIPPGVSFASAPALSLVQPPIMETTCRNEEMTPKSQETDRFRDVGTVAGLTDALKARYRDGNIGEALVKKFETMNLVPSERLNYFSSSSLLRREDVKCTGWNLHIKAIDDIAGRRVVTVNVVPSLQGEYEGNMVTSYYVVEKYEWNGDHLEFLELVIPEVEFPSVGS